MFVVYNVTFKLTDLDDAESEYTLSVNCSNVRCSPSMERQHALV